VSESCLAIVRTLLIYPALYNELPNADNVNAAQHLSMAVASTGNRIHRTTSSTLLIVLWVCAHSAGVENCTTVAHFNDLDYLSRDSDSNAPVIAPRYLRPIHRSTNSRCCY